MIKQLRPVTFNWKEGHEADLGLIAEEVNAVEPLLNTYNNKGEIEGVKYEQLTVVLINAVKEQQAQIEQQQQQLRQQRTLIDGLRKLVCQNNPHAEVCKGSATK